MSLVRRTVRLGKFMVGLAAIVGSIITVLGWLYPPSQLKEPNPPSQPPVQNQPIIVQTHVVVPPAAGRTTSTRTTYTTRVYEVPSPSGELREARPEPPTKVEIVVNAHSSDSPKSRPSESSWSGLLSAAGRGSHDSVKRWLASGADPNAASDYGKTSLMLAAENGHHDVCRTLISQGARPDLTDSRGRNALHYAAEGGHNDLVRFLLDHGVSADAVDNEGNTPLALAQRGGHRTCAKAIEQSYR